MKLTIKQLRRLIKEALTAANIEMSVPGITASVAKHSLGEYLDNSLSNKAHSGDFGPHVGGSGPMKGLINYYFTALEENPEAFIFKKHSPSSFDENGPTVGQYIDNAIYGAQDLATFEGFLELSELANAAFDEYAASRRGLGLHYKYHR